ncbi:MAG: acyl--CoA ligase [Oscillochloridaceae bacterium umkhey_bin13]
MTLTIDLSVPTDFNWAYDVVDQWAADPQKLAMRWVSSDHQVHDLTFAELRERTNRLANGLEALGLQRGERVFVMLPRLVAWWETMLGLIKLGAVAMPGTTLLTPKDIAYRINTAEVSAVITDADGAAKLAQIQAQCPSLRIQVIVGSDQPGWHNFASLQATSAPERPRQFSSSTDPCLVYFTSGTVGNPKMVLHNQSYPIGHRITGAYWLALGPADLHWNLSDTGWAKAAWSSLFGPWNMGAALFVHDGRGKYNPRETLDLLAQHPISSFCAAPTIYRLLVQEDLKAFQFPHLRSCVGAGEPLNPEVIEVWQQATGITIRDGYGQTESVLLCGNPPGAEVRPGSMGRPLPGIELAVIDDDNQPLPPRREGDLAVKVQPKRPVGLFQEYWRSPAATAACHRGDWYVTGDRAYVDEDGYFWFVGRADDVIISAGYRIGPFEVESALIEHPAVAEAAVVAKPDAERGSIVKAYVVLSSSYQPSEALAHELQEFVKSLTAPYKYPREIEFMRDLPKTVSGKIRRVELRGKAATEG